MSRMTTAVSLAYSKEDFFVRLTDPSVNLRLPPPLQGGLTSFLPEGEVPQRGGGVVWAGEGSLLSRCPLALF